jgi:hypothetical protein
LTDYEAAIHELLGATPDAGTPMRGPSGMALTPAQNAVEFDGVEKEWREYRGKACQAARDQMGGGTAAPSAEMRCEVNLDHSHMRELDSIYWLALHK